MPGLECPGGCTRTYGYWKTHDWDGPAGYDITWDALNGGHDQFLNTGKSYTQILNRIPSGGNAYIILAHQYIAAELNDIANDNDFPIEFFSEMDNAKDILLNCHIMIINKKINSEYRSEAIRIAGVLDDFNNGYLYPNWPHCDDNFIIRSQWINDLLLSVSLKIM